MFRFLDQTDGDTETTVTGVKHIIFQTGNVLAVSLPHKQAFEGRRAGVQMVDTAEWTHTG